MEDLMHTRQMLQTHPKKAQIKVDAFGACIEACFDCSQACAGCADACLSEQQLQDLIHCIRLNLDCEDICATTGRMLSRLTNPAQELLRSQIETCLMACQLCAEVCEKYADKLAHCAACADACRRCEEACRRLVGQAFAQAA
jgi:hypothetical protein